MQIQNLKDSISKGNTELVINALLINLKEQGELKDIYNQIILLSSKFQMIKHNQLLSNHSYNDTEIAKINSSILDILDTLSDIDIDIPQLNIDYELYETRDSVFGRSFEKWLEIVMTAKEIVAINGIPRFFWDIANQDVILRKKIKDLFSRESLDRFTIIWDLPHNQAYRYYMLKAENEYYSQDDDMDLNKHIYDKAIKPISQISKLMGKYHKLQLKVLPFPLSYSILKADDDIYVVLMGATKWNQSPTIKLSPQNELLYNHFNNLVKYLVKTDLVPELSLDQADELNFPEFLHIVSREGRLLTQLPKKYVEQQNRNVQKEFRDDFAHRHIYCLVLSKSNRILIQKRSSIDEDPGLWDKSLGGHVTFDETSLQACIRELGEELNIEYDPMIHDLIAIHQQTTPEEHARVVSNPIREITENKAFELFLLKYIDEEEIAIDNAEVMEFQWKTIEELKEFVKSSQVTFDLKKIVNDSRILDIVARHMR